MQTKSITEYIKYRAFDALLSAHESFLTQKKNAYESLNGAYVDYYYESLQCTKLFTKFYFTIYINLVR